MNFTRSPGAMRGASSRAVSGQNVFRYVRSHREREGARRSNRPRPLPVHLCRYCPGTDRLRAMPDRPSFTLGIEEEFQVVDPQTRELKSHIAEMFAEGEKRLKDEIKREMHEAVIEVGTPICENVAHARREITRLR